MSLLIYLCYCKGTLGRLVWDYYKQSRSGHPCELLLHEALTGESPNPPAKEGLHASLPLAVAKILGALYPHQYLGLPSHSFRIQLSFSHPGMSPTIPFLKSPGLSPARQALEK